MNNRIEQLAEQVDLLGDFIPTKIPGRYAGTIDIATIEKFAQLIVRECADLCHNQALIESEKGSLESLYKIRALDAMGVKIAEHFGVE